MLDLRVASGAEGRLELSPWELAASGAVLALRKLSTNILSLADAACSVEVAKEVLACDYSHQLTHASEVRPDRTRSLALKQEYTAKRSGRR